MQLCATTRSAREHIAEFGINRQNEKSHDDVIPSPLLFIRAWRRSRQESLFTATHGLQSAFVVRDKRDL